MALPIERPVVRDQDFAVGLGRDAGSDAAPRQSIAEPVGVLTSVTEHGLGFWQGAEHQGRALIVAGLTLGELVPPERRGSPAPERSDSTSMMFARATASIGALRG